MIAHGWSYVRCAERGNVSASVCRGVNDCDDKTGILTLILTASGSENVSYCCYLRFRFVLVMGFVVAAAAFVDVSATFAADTFVVLTIRLSYCLPLDLVFAVTIVAVFVVVAM